MDMDSEIEIRHLYISSGHRFVGRHGKEPAAFEMQSCDAIECVAGKGICGDRYFHHPDDKRQLTFFSGEVYEALRIRFEITTKGPEVFRRNAIVWGVDLNKLIGVAFSIRDVAMIGIEEARPCYWMNRAFCPDAEKALRGKGGLRVRILSSGILRIGKHPLKIKS